MMHVLSSPSQGTSTTTAASHGPPPIDASATVADSPGPLPMGAALTQSRYPMGAAPIQGPFLAPSQNGASPISTTPINKFDARRDAVRNGNSLELSEIESSDNGDDTCKDVTPRKQTKQKAQKKVVKTDKSARESKYKT